MEFQRYLAAAVLAIGLCAVAADAAPNDTELSARAGIFAQAAEYVGKDPDKVIVLLQPVIAAYEADYKDNLDTVFCAEGPTETLAVLLDATANNKDAVAIDGTYCGALFLTGFSLIDLGRPGDAGIFLQKASDRAPLNGHYLNELAEWHKRQRDWQTAYDMFARASELGEFAPDGFADKQTARSLRGMGFALIELGKLDEAETRFNESLKREPGNPSARNELQYIKEQRGAK